MPVIRCHYPDDAILPPCSHYHYVPRLHNICTWLSLTPVSRVEIFNCTWIFFFNLNISYGLTLYLPLSICARSETSLVLSITLSCRKMLHVQIKWPHILADNTWWGVLIYDEWWRRTRCEVERGNLTFSSEQSTYLERWLTLCVIRDVLICECTMHSVWHRSTSYSTLMHGASSSLLYIRSISSAASLLLTRR